MILSIEHLFLTQLQLFSNVWIDLISLLGSNYPGVYNVIVTVWPYQYSSCSCVSTVIKLINVPLNTDLTNHRSHDNREVLQLHEKNEDPYRLQ